MFPRIVFSGRYAILSQLLLALLGVAGVVLGLVQGDSGWLILGTVAILVAAINFATRRIANPGDDDPGH